MSSDKKPTETARESTEGAPNFPSELPPRPAQRPRWYERVLTKVHLASDKPEDYTLYISRPRKEPKFSKGNIDAFADRRIIILHGHRSKLCEWWFLDQKSRFTDKYGSIRYELEYECFSIEKENLELERMDLKLMKVGGLKGEDRERFIKMIANRNRALDERSLVQSLLKAAGEAGILGKSDVRCAEIVLGYRVCMVAGVWVS
ncbi:uncharacterized protein DSM5745_04445 [Aspergillus mulundensis]|uniref:Uncharacterized protein n=1 Tax=Aspergillus mulundensis TaxID=1810919 RepID=A0A3D8SCT9_9EURO|nr:hypothetical protein DSM5745_04445 [Aspergillus mulundensis]RDW84119.1 hypothetical protein DSM5745_04445 [Aspergillus mulundensis]